MAKVVGLTGGLAAGKSTVARWLSDAGFLVIDADRLVAELYGPGERGSRAVGELFGNAFLTPHGAVDHGALAALVFDDRKARHRLEKVIHPLVRQRFRELAEAQKGIAILEATLLVEAGQADDFDLVVSVEAPIDIRLERAIERGMPEETAKARLLAQGDGQARRASADLILDSGGSLEELRHQVDDLIEKLQVHPG